MNALFWRNCTVNDLYTLHGGCMCSVFGDVDDVTCAWESMYKDILDGYI